MKISMYAWFVDIVARDGIEKAADLARELGFEAVEFIDIYGRPSFVPNQKTAKYYRKALESRGLSVACYSVAVDLIRPNEPDYNSQAALEFIKHAAKMAQALGAPYLHHTLIKDFRYDEKTYEKNFDSVLDRVLPLACEIADFANSLALVTLYEPQGLYFNGKQNFEKFYIQMKALGKNIGVCGDMGNSLFCDWRPEDFYSTFAHDIKHVHAKDYALPSSQNFSHEGHIYSSIGGQTILPCALGNGDVDICYCLKKVFSLGYSGAISLEGEYSSPIQQMHADIDYLSSLHNDI